MAHIPSGDTAALELLRFEDALQQRRQGESIILCYHGVPDRVHPWVNVEPDTFREQMRKIAEITNDVRALNGAY